MAFRRAERPFTIPGRTDEQAKDNARALSSLADLIPRRAVEALVTVYWADPAEELRVAFGDPASLADEVAASLAELGQDSRKLADDIRKELEAEGRDSNRHATERLSEEVEFARTEVVRQWLSRIVLVWTRRRASSMELSPTLEPPDGADLAARSAETLASAIAVRPADAQRLRDWFARGVAERLAAERAGIPLVDGLVLRSEGGRYLVRESRAPERGGALRRLLGRTDPDGTRSSGPRASYTSSSTPSTTAPPRDWTGANRSVPVGRE